jgi:hypothetical protein
MATASFPNSNLPLTSQPWGREVEKRLVDTALTVRSNEINNNARDTQLAASLNRVNSALLKAQEAIDSVVSVEEAVYYPGTTEIDGGNIRANTIAANKISAGELVGFTVKTGYTDNQRVELNSSNIAFLDSNNNSAGSISASVYSPTQSSLNIQTSTGGAGLFATNGIGSFFGTGCSIQVGTGTYGNIDISATNANAGVTLSGSFVSTGARFESNGLNSGDYIQCLDTYNRNVQSGRIMYVASNGTYNSASSSERYKQDITPYEVDMGKLMQLEPVSFRYKQSVAELGDSADVAHGFIAEQADAIGLTEFVDYEADEEGNLRPDNFRYIDFTAALLDVVKKQQVAIESLSARLDVLESK